MSYCLPGVRTAGLFPRGIKREVCSSSDFQPVKHSQVKHILNVMCYVCCFILSFRSYWRNKASWIPSAECWASGSSWGREQGITSASGSTVSKAPSAFICTQTEKLFCTHIGPVGDRTRTWDCSHQFLTIILVYNVPSVFVFQKQQCHRYDWEVTPGELKIIYWDKLIVLWNDLY